MTFNVKLPTSQKIFAAFNPEKFQKEHERQLTDTARKTRTIISQQVRQIYKVPAALLGGGSLSTVKIISFAGQRVLSYKANMIGLDKMSAARTAPKGKPKRRGVKVTVKKGQRKLVKGGFLGRSRDRQREFVYRRVTDASGKTLKTRNGKDKLERLRTISTAHMVSNTPIVQRTDEVFKHFENGLRKRLEKIS